MKKSHDKDRRDWLLLLLALPLGILFMMVAGQRATQLLPYWSLRANIGSNINLNAPFQRGPNPGFAPINSDILTPPAWRDTFLTPTGDDTSTSTPPTLMVFQPSKTPTATSTPPPTTKVTTQPTDTVTATDTTTATPPPTQEKKKKKKKKNNPPPPTSTATSTATAVPTYAVAAADIVTPDAGSVNVNAPGDSTYDGKGTNWFSLPDGKSTIIDLGSNPVVVNGPSDTNYDLAYYERPQDSSNSSIAMDAVKIGISHKNDGTEIYQVFNWGDGTPDTNSNLDTSNPPPTLDASEPDNQVVSTNDLYKDPAASPTAAATGVLIDVDNAPSKPPTGSYQYVVISAPTNPPNNGNDGADVDAVQTVDVPP